MLRKWQEGDFLFLGPKQSQAGESLVRPSGSGEIEIILKNSTCKEKIDCGIKEISLSSDDHFEFRTGGDTFEQPSVIAKEFV